MFAILYSVHKTILETVRYVKIGFKINFNESTAIDIVKLIDWNFLSICIRNISQRSS